MVRLNLFLLKAVFRLRKDKEILRKIKYLRKTQQTRIEIHLFQKPWIFFFKHTDV